MAKVIVAALAAFAALEGAGALRKGSSRSKATSGWVTDAKQGVCGEHIKLVRDETPVHIPLLCTAPATGLKLKFRGRGFLYDKMRFEVNGKNKQEKTWPWIFPHTTNWDVDVGNLPAGTHIFKFWGDVKMEKVQLEGSGAAACSFEAAPNFARLAEGPTYGSFDAFNNLFGPQGVPYDIKVKQHNYFSAETLGKTADGSIDSMLVSDGIWKWLLEYTQDPSPDDPLGEKKLWNESLIKPWKNIQLDAVRGRSGQRCDVVEPCNTLSALVFHEAADWVTCKGYHFTQDEYASIITAFNALAAGTVFVHVCGCDTGAHADTFTMKWLMMQIYQIMTRDVVDQAGDRLTQAEKDAIDNMGHNFGKVTDMSKNLTRLFSEKYDRDFWAEITRAIDIPDYTMSITGVVIFTLYGLEGRFPIPGLDWALNELIKALMNVFPVPDKEFFISTYIPSVKKALSFSKMCNGAAGHVVEHLIKFAVTFIEALVFQEEVLQFPKEVRDVIAWFDRMGLTGDLVSDMKRTWNLYNGYDCKARSDHANWHEKAAHGLIHFAETAELFVSRHNC